MRKHLSPLFFLTTCKKASKLKISWILVSSLPRLKLSTVETPTLTYFSFFLSWWGCEVRKNIRPLVFLTTCKKKRVSKGRIIKDYPISFFHFSIFFSQFALTHTHTHTHTHAHPHTLTHTHTHMLEREKFFILVLPDCKPTDQFDQVFISNHFLESSLI